MATPSPLRIERREFKYLVSRDTAARVRDAVAAFCVLDRHAALSPDHRYTIESLYLDTPSLALYRANEVELLDRVKLRVRHYPDHPGGDVFLEVKRRVHDVIDKTRGRLPHDGWQRLVDDPFAPLTGPAADNPAVERFLAIQHTLGARPGMLVRYQREAWMGIHENYARVTFDTAIRAQICEVADFAPDPGHWRPLDDAYSQKSAVAASAVVLELKFESLAPTWMQAIIESLDLWRLSYSKYGNGVQAFFVPPESRMEAVR